MKRHRTPPRRPGRFRQLTLLAALALTGCGPDPGNGASATLRYGNGSELQSLDFQIVTGMPEARVLRALYEGLVTLDPDTLDPRPGVAERWEASADGTRWTFHLRPDARWSNGDPVTASDFRDAYSRILNGSLGAPYASQLFILRGARAYHAGEIPFDEVGVRAPDPRTLEIELTGPIPFFLHLLANYPWYPLHRPSVENAGGWDSRAGAWARPGVMVSNGPFELATWKLNEVLEVRRNPHYAGERVPSLDRILFLPISDAYTEERAFLDGLLDVTSIVPSSRVLHYLETPGASPLQVDPDLGTYYLLLNTAVPPLDDPRVRQALSLALDRQAISRDIRLRGEPVATHFTPPGIGGYQPPALLRHDPGEARRLLAEAGYPGGRGFPTIDYLFNTSETHRPIAEAIQAMWQRELGIDIRLTNQEWKTYLANRANRNFQIARAGWLGDYPDPDTFLGLWTADSTNNFSGWSNPDYDRLLQRTRELPAGPARYEAFAEAEAILLEELPVLPIFFYNRAYLRSDAIQGWASNVLGYQDYRRLSVGPDRGQAGDSTGSPPTGG